MGLQLNLPPVYMCRKRVSVESGLRRQVQVTVRLPTPSATVIPTNRARPLQPDSARDSPEPRALFVSPRTDKKCCGVAARRLRARAAASVRWYSTPDRPLSQQIRPLLVHDVIARPLNGTLVP